MKSYVFRRRFNPAAVGNENVKIFLPKGFGTPKFGISFFTNGGEGELLDETTLDRSFGIGLVGLGASNNALHAWNASTGFTHAAAIANTHRKAISATVINGRFGTESRTDRQAIRQCTSPAFFEDRFEFTLSNSIASSSYFDLVMILFSGDDIDARIGYVPLGLTNGATSTITGMAFAPDVVLTLGTGFGLGNSGEDARFCFGCALKGSTIKNSASLFRMRSNPDGGTAGISTTVHQYFSTDRCFLTYGTGANSNSLALADVTAFTSDGFTVTSRSTFFSNITNVMMYIALKCTTPGAFDLQNFTSSTSTGVVGTATSNFIPSLILGAFGSATSTGATITSNDSTGYSVFAAKSLSSKSIYGPGTISVSSGSTSVTGTGTSFKQFSPGDKIFNATNVEVGTVSYVSSDTSLFIASNASSTITTQTYSTLPKLEFSANIGSSNLSSPTKIFSGLLPAPIYSAIYGTSSSASEIVDGLVNNFDSYPGFKVNYLTANATGRKGWFLAIKDTELRRRDGN